MSHRRKGSRSPRGERGLKYVVPVTPRPYDKSLPSRGARVEIWRS